MPRYRVAASWLATLVLVVCATLVGTTPAYAQQPGSCSIDISANPPFIYRDDVIALAELRTGPDCGNPNENFEGEVLASAWIERKACTWYAGCTWRDFGENREMNGTGYRLSWPATICKEGTHSYRTVVFANSQSYRSDARKLTC